MKTTLRDLLARFEGVRPMRPGSWAAKCPVHDDRHGSLVISEGRVRTVCCCHAGCPEPEVLAAVNASERDLYYDTPDDVERPDGTVNIGRVTATPPAMTSGSNTRTREHTHHAASVNCPPEHVMDILAQRLKPLYHRLYQLKGWGATAIEHCRLGWESDDPRHPDARIVIPNYGPDGRMIGYVRYKPGSEPKSIAVGPRELYPAPETLPAGDGVVWLVEGEPDRVSAVELGLNATALPGIGKWQPEWAARFKGRRVIVCLDCDEACCAAAMEGRGRLDGSSACGVCGNPKRRPYGGRNHAQKVCRSLHDAGVEAGTVDLFPGRTDGYDLGDALTAASRARRVDHLRRYLIKLEDQALNQPQHAGSAAA